MEVVFCVPLGADISVVRAEYSDIYQDEGWDDHDRYYIGKCSDDDATEDGELIHETFLTRRGCIRFCGFAEACVEGGNCLIEGNGPWAQGLLGREDFSDWACDETHKLSRMHDTSIYKEGWAAGKLAMAMAALEKAKAA